MDVLGDELVSASLHEVLTVVCDPIDDLMTRLVKLGFQPITQPSTLLFAICMFTVRYSHHINEGVEMETSLELAKADVISHPVISSFLARQAGETIDRSVRN